MRARSNCRSDGELRAESEARDADESTDLWISPRGAIKYAACNAKHECEISEGIAFQK